MPKMETMDTRAMVTTPMILVKSVIKSITGNVSTQNLHAFSIYYQHRHNSYITYQKILQGENNKKKSICMSSTIGSTDDII
jgi:hypothetical protein